MKKLLLTLFALTLCITGCGSSQTSFNKGEAINIEMDVSADKETSIGDTGKDGISVVIPENALADDAKVILKTMSEEATDTCKVQGFDFFGAPVSIEVEGAESVRLDQPATITITIPENQLEAIDNAEDVYAAYLNKGEWEYFIPDSVDLEDGTVEFTTFHFSDFASGKLSRQKQLNRYAEQMAVQTWVKSQTEQNFEEATKAYFYDLMENKLGITDSQTKGKILRNIIKQNDFGDLIVKLEQGDMSGFSTKVTEMTSKAILDHAQLDSGFVGKWSAIASTGATAAGHIVEGDYTQAMKDISLALMDQHILGKLFLAGVEVTDTAIKNWKSKSIEDAFQAYKNGANGEHGYDVDAGDFDALSYQMRGIMHKIYSDAIDSYCIKNNTDRSKLDTATMDSIRAQAERKLKADFDKRIAEQAQIDEQKAYHMKIIQAFDNSLLLKRGSFGYDYDTTLERRIERLHIVMENILEQTGMKLNIQLIDSTDTEMSLDDLCTLLGVWYNDHTEFKEEYFAKLKSMGFIKEESASTGEGEYAWVLSKNDIIDEDAKAYIEQKNKDYEGVYFNTVSYGRGEYSHTWTYVGPTDDYYDPPMENGETISFEGSFSSPPEVIKGGEEISITVSLAPSGMKLSYFTGSGYVKAHYSKNNSAWRDFVNEDGKPSFRSYSKNNYESFNETVSATMPSGGEGSTLEIEYVFSSGPKMATTYVYKWQKID